MGRPDSLYPLSFASSGPRSRRESHPRSWTADNAAPLLHLYTGIYRLYFMMMLFHCFTVSLFQCTAHLPRHGGGGDVPTGLEPGSALLRPRSVHADPLPRPVQGRQII
eukprot:770318-Prorocentrum_minimum.AAC.1